MERMLINATQAEELRVAVVDGQYLFDLDIERPSEVKKKANIYKGKITRIEPSLEAAFIEYGANRQGFLPLKEVAHEYFKTKPSDENRRPSIKEALREGQELLVQVEKDERGTKGAALTTFITLAGCYLVLMPNNPRAGGISRRIEGDERDELRDIINNLQLPEGMGVIVRTAGLGKDKEDIEWDLEVLINQWNAIKSAFDEKPAPFLIHQEGDVIIRSIRDNLRKNIGEIIIDNQETFVKAKNYLERVRPDFLTRLKLYQDTVPLFSRYQIETQIESAYQREVALPSGGFIVIDRTEALVSVDINSAKATGGVDIEETALNTNLEAATEMARQLRLRDLGGLIVIDFIDMSPVRNQRAVENRLRESLRVDRARIQIGRISRFGLLEMSRQRLRAALGEASQKVCPRCDGRGVVRTVESLALSIVRLIEEDALKESTSQVQVQLPVEVGTFLLNEKREAVADIEKRHQIQVVIIPNQYLQTPHYKIARVRSEENPSEDKAARSYKLLEVPEVEIPKAKTEATFSRREEPLIKEAHAPQRKAAARKGILSRLFSWLFGTSKPKKARGNQQHGHQRRHHHKAHGQNRPHHHKGRRRPSRGGRDGDSSRGGGGGRQRSGQRRPGGRPQHEQRAASGQQNTSSHNNPESKTTDKSQTTSRENTDPNKRAVNSDTDV